MNGKYKALLDVSDKISWHGEKPKRIATPRLRGRRERDIDFILSHAILSIIIDRLGVLNVLGARLYGVFAV
jgi:hypothetical protein